MSSPKPPGRGRVLGVGKAGWAHLRPKSRTRVCSAERPLWGLGPSEMTAAPRGVPGDPVPGREGFPPCQIRWAVSCQPLSAGLRSTDESLQVSQGPPPPAAPWPASWVARGSESISRGGSWDRDWAQRVGECQCPSGLAVSPHRQRAHPSPRGRILDTQDTLHFHKLPGSSCLLHRCAWL